METSASSPCSGASCPDREDPDSAGGRANELGGGGGLGPAAGGSSSIGGTPSSEGMGGGAIVLPDGGINGGNDQGNTGGASPNGSGGAAAAGGEGGAGQGGSAPQTGTGGTMTAPPAPLGGIGDHCTSDADCSAASGLRCILSSSDAEFRGGGPEGGYCSVPCRGSDECFAIDGASACGLIDQATGSGFCIALCTLGAGDDKCGERAQACYPTTDPELGACFPLCRSDEGCGAGRFCDPGEFGLCVDAPPPGGGIGAPCTAPNAAAACASDICLIFPGPGGQTGFCSANCTVGSLAGCGFAPGSTAPREAACLQAQSPGGAEGDLGYCFELCDVAADCTQNSWACRLFDDDRGAALGRQGQCVPPQLAASEL